MKTDKEFQKKMWKFFPLFFLSAVVYGVLLWRPLGTFVFEYILIPLHIEKFFPGNPGIMGGLGIMFLGFIIVGLLVYLPYIIVMSFLLYRLIKKDEKKGSS